MGRPARADQARGGRDGQAQRPRGRSRSPRSARSPAAWSSEGKITRKAHLRINPRRGPGPTRGKVASLRRFKDDVSEVQQGYECGVMVAGWNEIKQNDVIEAYEVDRGGAQL